MFLEYVFCRHMINQVVKQDFSILNNLKYIHFIIHQYLLKLDMLYIKQVNKFQRTEITE